MIIPMKRALILFSVILMLGFAPPSHKGKCGLVPSKAYTQNIYGKNIGYYVNFRNDSEKVVDGIKWKANFYDNFEELKGTREGSWQSGNFISPIEMGETAQDLENVWVTGATKIFITVTKVHFTDGTSCGK